MTRRHADPVTAVGLALGLALGIIGLGVLELVNAQELPGAPTTAADSKRPDMRPEPGPAAEPSWCSVPSESEPIAPEPRPTRRARPDRVPVSGDALELEAAILLARWTANEAGLEAAGDLLLIWQVAETHATTLAGRVRWMRRTSRCVLADVPPETWPPGRCRWTRYLDRSGGPPRNWPRSSGRWTRTDGPRWVALLELSFRVVTGQEPARPCDGAPQTWDGWRWHDASVANGYRPVTCSDPWTGARLANAGYRYPLRRARRAQAAVRTSELAGTNASASVR